jgi:CDP-diglyceride synthetase
MAKEEGKHLEIKKFDVLSVGKVFALLGAFAGFVFGLIVSFLMYNLSNSPIAQQIPNFTAVGWKQLVGLPFWYLLIFGLIWGLASMIFSLVYNQIARTGGIKLAVK